jgi:hypothetical protein
VGRLDYGMSWAKTSRVLRRDDEARALWAEVYPELSAGTSGMLGAATNRAAAQVHRLSVVYAAFDCWAAIRAEHLLAALAFWQYCFQSARWVFGDATGDPTADTILSALRRGGPLSRNDVVELFGRHLNRARIERALGQLLAAGLARREPVQTGGRPRELWHAT